VKYIDIKTIGPNAFQVWACHDRTNTVVMVNRSTGKLDFDRRALGMVNRSTGKLDFDRRALGLRVKKSYKPPSDTPGSFTRSEAISIAHQIGRYFFKLGDLVYAYTYVDGLRNDDFNRALAT
jgi:hypothetical protein